MVHQAHRVARERQATAMTAAIAAASSLPVRTESVELLTCRYAFHHMVDAEQVLAEFRRVLTDDGCFLLADTVAT
jgi:ubiquinone/menaquinone biosynthesis C-methylase UbiE